MVIPEIPKAMAAAGGKKIPTGSMFLYQGGTEIGSALFCCLSLS